MIATPWLAAALLLSAALSIAAAPWALSLPALAFVFKPLATLIVIAHAWRRGLGQAQRRWLLIGLGFSLAGDIALLWPQQGFLPGLVSFLVAHLAYLVAFTRESPLAARKAPFVAYALLAGAILAFLWGGIPSALRWPVLAYVVCLAAMAAQTAVVWQLARGQAGERRASLAALGGFLFMVSDALLAINRFHTPLPASSLWILASYWSAQWLLASSLKPATEAPDK